MANYRTKWIDPDFRRPPKTKYFCVRCERDLNPNKPVRYIAYELDTQSAVHSEDWEIAGIDIKSRRAVHLDAFVVGPVGMDCAKRIGIDYTRCSAE